MTYRHPEHQRQLDDMLAWVQSAETPELQADAAQTLMTAVYALYQALAVERRAGFRALRGSGLTHAELAEMFGVSRARVDQVLNY